VANVQNIKEYENDILLYHLIHLERGGNGYTNMSFYHVEDLTEKAHNYLAEAQKEKKQRVT
jgi:hypothetical protein